MELTDKNLKLVQKDPRFFDIIYKKYVKEIYAYAYYLSGNKHNAEDLSSMAFLRAIEKIDTFKGNIKQIRCWLYTITRNIFIDEIRKSKNREINIEIEYYEKSDSQPQVETDKKIMYENLLRQIDTLEPPIYKEVLLLKYKMDLTTKEIAQILKKREPAIRTLLHRATEKLKGNIYKDSQNNKNHG